VFVQFSSWISKVWRIKGILIHTVHCFETKQGGVDTLAIARHAISRHAISRHAISRHAISRHANSRHAISRHAICVMQFCVMQFFSKSKPQSTFYTITFPILQ
jgi:hypothetical protein